MVYKVFLDYIDPFSFSCKLKLVLLKIHNSAIQGARER